MRRVSVAAIAAIAAGLQGAVLTHEIRKAGHATVSSRCVSLVKASDMTVLQSWGDCSDCSDCGNCSDCSDYALFLAPLFRRDVCRAPGCHQRGVYTHSGYIGCLHTQRVYRVSTYPRYLLWYIGAVSTHTAGVYEHRRRGGHVSTRDAAAKLLALSLSFSLSLFLTES